MYWTVLVLSSIVLATARTRSVTSQEFQLEAQGPRDGFAKRNEIVWSPRYQKDLFGILTRLEEKSDTSQPKIARKRALSALSRWKPLGSLGIRIKSSHRVPARAPMISMVPDINFISAESGEGVRPLGQPLRWGKKR